MKVLVFGASLRAGSLNATLAALVAERLGALGHEVDLARFAEFDCPAFNQDALDSEGLAAGARAFNARFKQAQGFAVAAPEYVFAMPGSLKNLIDWSSREEPLVWTGKPGLLLAASVSSVGGQRGLWSLRVPLEALGSYVYPEMFSLPQADRKLGPDGHLTDTTSDGQLQKTIEGFLAFAGALSRR